MATDLPAFRSRDIGAPAFPAVTGDRPPLPTARTALLRSLLVTTHILVPLLVRTVPAGCDAAVLPLRQGGRVWFPRADRPLPAPAALPLPTRPSGARHDLSLLLDRAIVRLWRLSAWRGARSRTSRIPALTTARPAGAPRVSRAALATHPPTVTARDVPAATDAPQTDRGHQPRFPVDVVYTWVDDLDPVWRTQYAETRQRPDTEALDDETVGPARYRNRDELRYSLRSLALYAPFVRNVYIVTANQVPSWLAAEVPNLRVVPHEEILGPDCLPTFNSHAIESRLHHIEGLAEHYLYLNDDFFFARGCRASTFFTSDGLPRFFPDQRAMVPDGPVSPADRPVDSASKRTREIMASEFDFPVRYKMQHVPYPQRRSLLHEMEQRFEPWFKQTARNPFRHHTDVNIPSCLSHYYGFVTGAAVPGRIDASYINIGNPWAQVRMRRLLQRADRDVFCLNDTPMSPRRREAVDSNVRSFLGSYFPVPSPYEQTSGRSGAQAPVAGHVREAVQRG